MKDQKKNFQDNLKKNRLTVKDYLTKMCSLRLSALSQTSLRVFGALFICVSLLGIIGNALAICVFCRTKYRRLTKTKLLLTLIAADMITCSILCPIYITQMLNERYLTHCVMDIMRGALQVVLMVVSTLGVTFISYYRFINLKSFTKTFSPNIQNLILTLPWVLGLLLPGLRFVSTALYIVTVNLTIVVPLVTLTVFYVLICKEVKEQERKANVRCRKQRLMNVRIYWMIGCFVMCAAPVIGWMVFHQLNRRRNFVAPKYDQLFYLISMLFGCFNSIINPVLYAFKFPEFKKEIRRLSRKWKRRIKFPMNKRLVQVDQIFN